MHNAETLFAACMRQSMKGMCEKGFCIDVTDVTSKVVQDVMQRLKKENNWQASVEALEIDKDILCVTYESK